ncbi:hypothetical protein DIS24_g8459 [Lasiodiplodia hormozganensis]|uniref:Uncharacterized protein n=1 Tax=Lasiodiplodia hormozganensis TaxID=869390 RepID=A0AA40CNC8_9PEZI|nr:hypothetical protein DIS24_g8459 [Lasiodiplodia hormozganensis]
MPSLAKSLLLGVGLSQLAYAADGTVTFFRNRDCTGTEMWTGHTGSGTNIARGGDLHEALSFSYSGYFRLGIWDGPTVGSSKQCAYCSNNHADHSGGGCININTGYGPNYVFMNEQNNNPSDLPCRNFLMRCPFPVPPGNGLEAQ